MLASAQLFSLETAGGATSQAGYYQTLFGATTLLDEFLERLESVTAEQARAALSTALEGKRWVEVSVGPGKNGER